MQHDSFEKRTGVMPTRRWWQIRPRGLKVRGDVDWLPALDMTKLCQAVRDCYTGLHPLLTSELAHGVELRELTETIVEWLPRFEDKLKRDWLPYSSD